MKTVDILRKVNDLLAGELLTYQDLETIFDIVIDEINHAMNTTYPSMSELREAATGAPPAEYNCFPDRYIRSVLCFGAAYKFYTMDEEGIDTAPAYRDLYYNNLFHMQRDYTETNENYLADEDAGSLLASPDLGYTGGLDINGSIWNI